MGIIEQIFKEATGQNVTSLRILENGFSNDSYLVNKEFVLRLKKTSDAPFYSPSDEKKIIDAVSQYRLCPKLLYFDNSSGNKLERFLPEDHYFPKGNLATAHDLSLMASCLKRLHAVQGNFKGFYAFERYVKYKNGSGENIEPEFESQVLAKVGGFFEKEPQVLCHNDLWSDNILYYKGMVVLIDFEFAGMNNPMFDLASVIGENYITDKNTALEFLKDYYGSQLDDSKTRKIVLIVAFEDFMWYYWAKGRFLQTNHPAFLAIAQEKKDSIDQIKRLFETAPILWDC